MYCHLLPAVCCASRFLALLPRKLPQLSPSHLARTAWALAKLGVAPSAAWWQLLLTEAAGKLSQFDAK